MDWCFIQTWFCFWSWICVIFRQMQWGLLLTWNRKQIISVKIDPLHSLSPVQLLLSTLTTFVFTFNIIFLFQRKYLFLHTYIELVSSIKNSCPLITFTFTLTWPSSAPTLCWSHRWTTLVSEAREPRSPSRPGMMEEAPRLPSAIKCFSDGLCIFVEGERIR